MPPEFRQQRYVRFSETDMAGVMHFSNYFRWIEDIEHAFWQSLGLSVHMTKLDGSRVSWPRVAAHCEYRAPLKFEDEVELVLRVVERLEKAMTFEVEFLKAGGRCALGRITTVCCAMDERGFRSIQIPEEIRTKLEHAGQG